MLIGKIDKAFEVSAYRPARDLGKHRRQDRGEHRGVSRGTAGNGFLTILIAGSCWQLFYSLFKRESGWKSAWKSACQRLAIASVKDSKLTGKVPVNA